jgi:hypothetical protein
MDPFEMLGINPDELPTEEVGGYDNDLVKEFEEEVGAAVPSLSPQQRRSVAVVAARRSTGYESFLSASMSRVAEFSVRPNASLTFFGPNPVVGSTYPAGTPIILVPRTNNVPVDTLSTLSAGVTLIDYMVSPVDAANGWRLTIAKLGSDPIGSIIGDTALDVLRHDLGPNRSPLRTYLGSKIKSDTKLTLGMVHDRAAAQELIGGVTVTLIDRRCNQPNALEGSPAAASLAKLLSGMGAGGPVMNRIKQIMLRKR